MLKAVIFDLDGVLADTEPLHAQTRKLLYRELGIAADDTPDAAIGCGKREFWGHITEKYGFPCTGEELSLRDFSLVYELIVKTALPPTEGLIGLLKFLRESGLKTAVASSSDRKYVEDVLGHLGIGEYFCALACGNEVSAAKPAPFVYERALMLCGVRPEEAVAVGDSDTGAQAACAAGIPCIAFAERAESGQTFGSCVFRVKDMAEISEYIRKEIKL